MEPGADTPTPSENSNSGIPAWSGQWPRRIIGKIFVLHDFNAHQRSSMKPDLKACGQALLTATINAALALALMLLIEFAISGSFQLAAPYLWAVSLIGLVIFFAQFWRQRHLCRHSTPHPASRKAPAE
jgi:hypothetical protein